MDNMLTIKNLTMSFKKKVVLYNLNFSIKKGEIYGIVGNNGVGKTTLLKLICGLLKPTSGEIVFNDKDVKIGALIESPGIYNDMSAFDNLKAKSILFGLKMKKEQIDDLLEFVGLGDTEKKKAGKFSMGMKQRLGIALALMGDPDLLVLDEPINSLDPQGINDVNKIIKKIVSERNITVLISSHILDELVKVSTKFCFMSNGTIFKEISTSDMLNECGDLNLNEYYVKLLEE